MAVYFVPIDEDENDTSGFGSQASINMASCSRSRIYDFIAEVLNPAPSPEAS